MTKLLSKLLSLKTLGQKKPGQVMAEVRQKLAPGTPVEVWFRDEMRIGQKNKLTYRWARTGSRPRDIHDQRT